MMEMPTPIPLMGNININRGNAMLFLFSPRNIIDHYKRPLSYNFNNELVDNISENILRQPSANAVRTVMNSTVDIYKSIIPAARDGIHLPTSIYSDRWMFVLIVDENAAVEFSNQLSSRTISIGVCSDEPISLSGRLSATPEKFLNPHCGLIVTRYMELRNYNTLTANGPVQKTKTTTSVEVTPYDQDIWNRDMYYGLEPDRVMGATQADLGEAYSACIDTSESLNVKRVIRADSDIALPKKHMKFLLDSIENSSSQLMFDSRVDRMVMGEMTDKASSIEEFIHSNFQEQSILDQSDYSKKLMLSNTYMTLEFIKNKYNPMVHVIQTPQITQGSIIPQHMTSISTIFSSLVSNAIPIYMNQAGLSAVAFMYNSFHEASKIFHVESIGTVDQFELQRRWGAFEYLLRFELYPVLMANGGHFDLSVMSNINGTTDVILNFLDYEPLPVGAIYQENSVLGGITSQMIGTQDHLVGNSIELNNLVRNIATNVYHYQGNY